jgi:hypothetical protein
MKTLFTFFSGIFFETTGFFSAFGITALSAILVAVIIGRDTLMCKSQ